MKGIKLFLGCILIMGVAASCSTEDDYFEDDISLDELLISYESWYVDHRMTEGRLAVPFLEDAFTVSFWDGVFYVNYDNTRNGMGIDVGYYTAYDTFVVIDHDTDGVWEFDVIQHGNNEIELYDRTSGTSYFLVGR
ncbi:hypothetical protein [Sinomicrobium weinanense]|uniref:Lipoprotein n=1 Tax=Sinomicrobium weinanense TaxID=2842200 RepID=A0A926JNE3_9FLAO|nr:hypothetical protein [Sinomicrobium weinanense]MBC9794492.1 hypothetical protein [Sinomicrobium weinanense]MBU3124399.1 hypothetical protein [Sinomicrobium weinanense]